MSSRLPGDGKSFDDQWNHSRRLGEAKAARGEGPWAYDAALRRQRFQQSMEASPQPPKSGKHAKPSSDSCVTALGVLGGLAWAITETIRHLT